jgi:tRNA-binding EMAP/Myf-like protein
MENGFIYKITNASSGKSYIGQAREYKVKNDKIYKYGISGRWCDHLYEARKGSNKPLYIDILKFGKDSFQLVQLVKAPLEQLDALEANYIHELNTIHPLGYNIAAHSRNRHHKTLNLAHHFREKVINAELKKIKRNGIYHLVYLYLTLHGQLERERIVFGQTEGSLFDDAYKEAKEFLSKLECPFEERDDTILEEKYSKKIEQFNGKTITKIRVTSASNLIAVYIKTEDSTNQVRICFGGKNIKKDEALMIANTFISLLNIHTNTIIETTNQCLQQAAASMGETPP